MVYYKVTWDLYEILFCLQGNLFIFLFTFLFIA